VPSPHPRCCLTGGGWGQGSWAQKASGTWESSEGARRWRWAQQNLWGKYVDRSWRRLQTIVFSTGTQWYLDFEMTSTGRVAKISSTVNVSSK